MKKRSMITVLILLFTLSIFAETMPISSLIEKALEVSPTLKNAELTIEDAQIELKRALYNQASLSKNVLDAKREAVSNAIQALEKSRVSVKEETIKLALQSLKAQNSIRTREIALSQAERDLEIAVVKFERGTISLNELITAEDRVVTASDGLRSALETSLLADENLKIQIGLDAESKIEVEPELEVLVLDPTLDEIILAMQKSDNSYLGAIHTVSSRQEELDQMVKDNEATLAIRQKEIALEKARIDLASRKTMVTSSARTNFNSYLATKNALKNASLEVSRQQTRLEKANQQYENGLINLNSVIDIQHQLELAQMKEIEANLDLHIASLALQRLLVQEDDLL